jgi:hypothetical protein
MDIEEYENYDDPANADLYEVVPGKLIAFRGPHDLGGAMYSDASALRHTGKLMPFAGKIYWFANRARSAERRAWYPKVLGSIPTFSTKHITCLSPAVGGLK